MNEPGTSVLLKSCNADFWNSSPDAPIQNLYSESIYGSPPQISSAICLTSASFFFSSSKLNGYPLS